MALKVAETLPPGPPARARLRLALVLAIVVGAASALIPILATLAPLMREELSLSRFQVGTLATTYFGVGALCSLPAGRAVDTFGTRRLLSTTLVLAAAALVGIAVSGSYPMLLLSCVVAGLALCLSNPVTNAVIVAALRPGERGTTMGLKQAGVPAWGALMSLALPGAAVAFGWRGVVLATGLVMLALAPLVASVGTRARRGPGNGTGEPLGVALLWLGAYAFCMGGAGGSTTLYLPLYGHEVLGLSVAAAGFAAGVSQLMAIGSRIVWSRLSERSPNVTTPLALVSLCALGAAVPLALSEVAGPALFWLAAVAIGAGMLGWTPVEMLAGIRLVGPLQAGRASGVVVAGFYSGVMVGPAVFGYLVDASGGYAWGWGMVGTGFAAAAILALSHRRRSHPDFSIDNSISVCDVAN